MKEINIKRRNFLIASASAAALATLYFGAKSVFAKKTVTNDLISNAVIANARLGINLAGIEDWSVEQPFIDFFHMSREWVSQSKDGDWGTGPKLELDKNGWVKRLETGCYATRIICSHEDNQYPSGDYVILYEGEGELSFSNGTILENKTGRMVLKIDAEKGPFFMDIIKTNPSNYIRNIRAILPGFEQTYQNNPWHPDFLKRWSGIACLRFMDFMKTNNSTQSKWTNRPKDTDASYAPKGVPLELMVDLANRLNTDAWFCMPHQADDDYVKQFALYVKNNLKPELRAWVEYSNEVWNGGFDQNDFAGKAGQRLNFADKPWEAAWKFNAYRSVQIFKIWTEVYGGHDQFIRVLASQASSHYVSDQILSFQDAAGSADVLAVAPYVSLNVSPDSEDGIDEKVVASWSLEKLFDYINKVSLPESAKWIKDSKKVADQYGLKLVAYEAGQHLVGINGAENNEKLTKLFLQANADKRMGDVYVQNLATWEQLGGDLICSFNSMSGWSKWGSWGLLRRYGDLPASSPKFKAALKWAISRGQKITIE
jgi:hypothetical protein